MKRQVKREIIQKERIFALVACVLGLLLLLMVIRSHLAPSAENLQSSAVADTLRSSVLSGQASSSPAPLRGSQSSPKALLKPALNSSTRSGTKVGTKAETKVGTKAETKAPPKLAPGRTVVPVNQAAGDVHRLAEIVCLDRPDRPRSLTDAELEPLQVTLSLGRFRSTALNPGAATGQEFVMLAHPSNFGWRFMRDVRGRVVQNWPIVVLHETVGSYESAIGLFSTPHEDEDEQVSYHALIREDGKIVYTVPPDRRAYGAGDSVFVNSARQEESVKTSPNYPSSVNNFAYHISLVSPDDGYDDEADGHSGYTRAQYESLAWLVSKTGIPEDRLTTHQLVDRSGSRRDPRSFNVPYFLERLRSYPPSQEIAIGCAVP